MMFRTSMLVAVAAAAGADYSSQGDNWGLTVPLCDSGVEQSPINLVTTGTTETRSMALHGFGYEDFTIPTSDVERSTVKVQTNVEAGEFHLHHADQGVLKFAPAQFHLHAPSEHTVDGIQYDLEVHFVHSYLNGDLGGVIGVFFDTEVGGDEDNDFIAAIWDESADEVTIPVATFMKGVDMSRYWNYDGSLTTPPCDEGVKWTVIEDVQPISKAQLKKFTDLWGGKASFAGEGNYRNVQPLNARTLYFNSGAAAAAAATAIAAVALLAF